MKKQFLALFMVAVPLSANPCVDVTDQLPVINFHEIEGYERIPGVAQYKGADWKNVIGISMGVTIDQAKEIADNNPEITYFFYTKGLRLILEKEDGSYYGFTHGDAVFFSGDPWWGSAPGLADGYIKHSM